MSSVQDKLSQLESSIEQRLKWAAGANPSLNPTLERFESTLKERKRLIMVCDYFSSCLCDCDYNFLWLLGRNLCHIHPLYFPSSILKHVSMIHSQVESKYSSDICGISNAILHFEAFRTRTSEALAADQTLASLVQRYCKTLCIPDVKI